MIPEKDRHRLAVRDRRMNRVGLAVTGFLHFTFRTLFKMYGTKADIFTKKLGAVARKPGAEGARA